MRSDRDRLLDVAEAIARIEKYEAFGRERFEQDELIQTWIIHHLQIIGEAVRWLPQPFRDQHADWPWKSIVGMRHILVHGYFEVDPDIVWAILQNDLPLLKRQVEAALQELSPDET
jgi:uncharacterized protein with HEPN domain